MTRIVKNEKRTFFVFSVREAARLPIRLAILNRNDRSRRNGIDIVGKPVAALGSKRFCAFEHGSVLSFCAAGTTEAEVTASAAKAAGTQNPAAIKTAISLKGDDMLILPVPTLIGAGAYSGSWPGTAR